MKSMHLPNVYFWRKHSRLFWGALVYIENENLALLASGQMTPPLLLTCFGNRKLQRLISGNQMTYLEGQTVSVTSPKNKQRSKQSS